MQLSVIPNLLIYGDVKPEQLRKGVIKTNLIRLGVLAKTPKMSSEKALT